MVTKLDALNEKLGRLNHTFNIPKFRERVEPSGANLEWLKKAYKVSDVNKLPVEKHADFHEVRELLSIPFGKLLEAYD